MKRPSSFSSCIPVCHRERSQERGASVSGRIEAKKVFKKSRPRKYKNQDGSQSIIPSK